MEPTMAIDHSGEFHVSLRTLNLPQDAQARIAGEIKAAVLRELAKTNQAGVQIHLPKGWYGIVAEPNDRQVSLADTFPKIKS